MTKTKARPMPKEEADARRATGLRLARERREDVKLLKVTTTPDEAFGWRRFDEPGMVVKFKPTMPWSLRS